MDKLVDALYSRFLLRDFFGKIVPGGIVLFSVGTAYAGLDIVEELKELGFVEWMALLGLAWITAQGLQSVGESCGAFQTQPRGISYVEWRKQVMKFMSHRRHERLAQQFERITIIKEATGNAYIALFLSSVLHLGLYIQSIWGPDWKAVLSYDFERYWYLVILDIGVIASLARMHFWNSYRQRIYVETSIEGM